jgi:GxxExxY protein
MAASSEKRISAEVDRSREAQKRGNMIYQDQDLTHEIIGAAIEVHKILGPGLLESVYQVCLCYELTNRGLFYKKEFVAPLMYKNINLDSGFRVDLMVENKVILELKSIDSILPVHEAQLLTYLRLLKKQVGLLINFNVPFLVKGTGIRRCVLKAEDAPTG